MINYHEGQVFISDKTKNILKICHVGFYEKKVAVVNLTKLSKEHCNKPEVFNFGDFFDYCQKNKFCECSDHQVHIALTSSDHYIEKQFAKSWIEKRDEKWKKVSSICTEENVCKYLYGDGLGDEIAEAKSQGAWSTTPAYLHAINRFITFGCTKNAFLPIGYSRCGKFDRLNSKLAGVKVGCGGADNRNSRSKTRAVTDADKDKIKKCVYAVLKRYKKFSWTKAFEFYQNENFFIRDESNKSIHTIPEIERISFGQFYYHAKRLVPNDDILKKQVGRISYEKDHTPRTGSERDLLLGATDRYEIDATILDVHIRLSHGKAIKLSAGRPVLYLVVDAFSGMIVGMHLAVGNSVNVSGVSQALANACLPKKEFAARYGLNLSESDWPASHIPRQLTTDNGKEFPQILNESVLRSGLGIECINKTQAYRGDRKASVERAFHSLNQRLVHFLPGAVLKKRDRTEADPTNEATHTYDELMALLIGEIIKLNQNSACPERLDNSAVHDGITPTRQEIFLHSLSTSMHGGRPTSYSDTPRVLWSCLPEEEATVRDNGVFLDGLLYHCDAIESMGFYKRALSKGRFKIRVKRIRDWTNTIWYQTDDGQTIKLDLVNVNNNSPYQRLSWDIFPLINENIRDRLHQSEIFSLENSVRIDQLSTNNVADTHKLKNSPNSPRSRQKGIKNRAKLEKTYQLNESGNEINRVLTSANTPSSKTNGLNHQQRFLEDLYDN